jgi:hypothetical protein
VALASTTLSTPLACFSLLVDRSFSRLGPGECVTTQVGSQAKTAVGFSALRMKFVKFVSHSGDEQRSAFHGWAISATVGNKVRSNVGVSRWRLGKEGAYVRQKKSFGSTALDAERS